MIKFFSNYKIVFYSINFSLIFLYLFPGSLIGQVVYGSKEIQPQITPDFIISSNHFYVFVLVSIIGFLTFIRGNQVNSVPIATTNLRPVTLIPNLCPNPPHTPAKTALSALLYQDNIWVLLRLFFLFFLGMKLFYNLIKILQLTFF